MRASRSSGPGGQRTNRRSTKVQVWVSVGKLALSDRKKKIIREKLANRINHKDEIETESEDERSREQNRRKAVEKLKKLIKGALYENPPRIPTEPPRSAEEQRMRSKHLRYQKKNSRREAKRPNIENILQ